MKNLLLVAVLISLVSCDSNRIFEDNQDLEEAFWHKDSVISFRFTVPDATLRYQVSTNIRNSSAYPFHNLYYQYNLTDSTGRVLAGKLENINLFDPKTGQPNGSGLGDLFDHRQQILDDFEFPYSGEFEISFQQYMRMDSLPLILSVGARVELMGGE